MRVLIADDHDLLRDTLVLYLDNAGDFETEAAADFPAALRRMQDAPPLDMVILDFKMPGMNGLDGLRRALAVDDAPRVALISGDADRGTAEKALELGAAGFLPKTLSAKSFVNAVKFMAMGEKYAPLDFMTAVEKAPPNPLAEKLSERELQVLKGLTEGKSNKGIARDLDLMEPTVKLYMKTLYRKLGVSNRTQAALIAKEASLF